MGGDGQRLLIFDFDGTLFHLPVDFAAVRHDLGVGADTKIGPLLQQFLDTGDEASLAVVTKHECAAVPAGAFLPGALACLAGPGQRAIVTRNSRHAVLAALGERAGEVLVVGREDVRRLKPDPDGVQRVLATLGVAAPDATLIGDTYHDVQAARAAGVRSVVVRNPRLDYPPAGADQYIDELGTVLRPTDSAGKGT